MFPGSCAAQRLGAGIPAAMLTAEVQLCVCDFPGIVPKARPCAVAQTTAPLSGAGTCLWGGFGGSGARQHQQEGNESFNLSALAAPGLQN